MAITKLQLYNIALTAIGETRLSALTDATESRRLLDEVYDRGTGAVDYFLEQGLWNFALRAAQVNSNSAVTPDFGFTYGFDIPTDFIRLDMISADEQFRYPLSNYEHEASYWYADVDPIYVRYVSNDASYGGSFAKWPNSLSIWAGHWLATQIAPATKSEDVVTRLEKRTEKLLLDAKSKDMSQEPARFSPPGSWVSARHGQRTRSDRGKRSTLIG